MTVFAVGYFLHDVSFAGDIIDMYLIGILYCHVFIILLHPPP